MEHENSKMTKEDLTGKAEQSEAAESGDSPVEQTERERDNKGAGEATPDVNKERDELKEAPESLKNSH